MKCLIYNTSDSLFMRIDKVGEQYKETLKKYNYTEENGNSYIELKSLQQFKELTIDLNETVELSYIKPYSERDIEFYITIKDGDSK